MLGGREAWLGLEVLASCCLGQLALEFLLDSVFLDSPSQSPHTMLLLTWAQLLTNSIAAIPLVLEATRSDPAAFRDVYRLIGFAVFSVIHGIVSFLNNQAFKHKISVFLSTIYRSSSSVVGMLIGFIVFQKAYSRFQIIGCVSVSFGIGIALSEKSLSSLSNCCSDWFRFSHFDEESHTQGFGILLLSLATVIASTMGHIQQNLYSKYGRESQWKFMAFFTNFLPMIIISAFNWTLLLSEMQDLSTGAWMWISAHLFFQQFCAMRAFKLSGKAPNICEVCSNMSQSAHCGQSSVTFNLILTVRKFISLVLSKCLFDHQLSEWHLLGAGFVVFGGLIYSTSEDPNKRKMKIKDE